MKSTLLVAAAAALTLIVMTTSSVRAERLGTKTLKGLAGVQVVIEDVDSDLVAAGVTKDTLQSNIEAQLKDAGIKVYDDDDWKADSSHPYLYVRVNSMQSGDNKFVAFSLDIELHQDVNLVRDSDIDTLATTWETGSFGILEVAHAKRIYKSVEKEVGEFVEDFGAQNSASIPHASKAAKAAAIPKGRVASAK